MTSRAIRRAQQKRDSKQARRIAAAGILAVGTGAPLGAAVILAPSAEAATLSVTNLADSGAGSLRAAVATANASAGADTITFSGAATSGVIQLTSGELEITDDVTITGPGSSQVTLQAGTASRVFNVHPADVDGTEAVVISGLKLAGGAPTDTFYYDGATYEAAGNGGAITANRGYYGAVGSLSLTDVTVVGGHAASGGAVYANGIDLDVKNSSFSGNEAESAGGAIRADRVALTGSTLADNTAGSDGGAVLGSGQVSIADTEITDNHAARHGGGVRVYSGQVHVVDSTVADNSAGSNGGGLRIDGAATTIERTVVSGNTAGQTAGGVFLYGLYGGTDSISDSLVSGNSALYSGGGLATYLVPDNPVDIENVTIVGNTVTDPSGVGGGVFARYGGTRLTASTVSGNSAGVGGGVFSSGGATVRDTIVANNAAGTAANGDLARSGITGDQPVSLDFSLVEATPTAGTTTTVTAGSNIVGVDPQLGSLANNGGPTQTLKPAAASPVVDKGTSYGLVDDQRGRNRPVDLATVANRAGGDGADIGAVELSSTTDTPPASAVANTAAPSVPTAAPQVNVPVTVTEGTWTPSGVTFKYQWFAGTAKIAGANARTYTPGPADAGYPLSVRVTGSKAGYSSVTVTSNATDPVADLQGVVELENNMFPTIAGTPAVGSTITATGYGTWNTTGLSYRFQWLRKGSPIPGAVGSSYLLGPADVGSWISVRVTALKPSWAAGSATSAQTASVVRGTLAASGTPKIVGTLKVKKTLTASAACRPAATATYQWLRNGKPIKAATKSKYKLAKADKGKKISVRVTFTKSGYNTKVVTIAKAGKVK